VIAGAFCISSNRVSSEKDDSDQGGGSWVIDPDGEVVGLTTEEQPFLTVELDLSLADRAKGTYPRYVSD
jgi:N-carbamoylputrescine amidase